MKKDLGILLNGTFYLSHTANPHEGRELSYLVVPLYLLGLA